MKRVFILLLYLSWTSLAIAGNRVMLIGNSITVGIGSFNGLGFRDDLYEKLSELGYPFSFVGIYGYPPYCEHFQSGATIGQFYTGPGG